MLTLPRPDTSVTEKPQPAKYRSKLTECQEVPSQIPSGVAARVISDEVATEVFRHSRGTGYACESVGRGCGVGAQRRAFRRDAQGQSRQRGRGELLFGRAGAFGTHHLQLGLFRDTSGRGCYGSVMAEPSYRKLVGIAAILLTIAAVAAFVAALARVVWQWPVLVQATFYLLAGTVWIIPLKPLVRWIETGSFRAGN